MADKSDPPAPVQKGDIAISDIGSAHAPFLFFEQASALGCYDGVVRITLEAIRIYPDPNGPGVVAERVVTAHLRMGVSAAQSLKRSIESALLLAAPVSSDAKN